MSCFKIIFLNLPAWIKIATECLIQDVKITNIVIEKANTRSLYNVVGIVTSLRSGRPRNRISISGMKKIRLLQRAQTASEAHSDSY
jgi:hypothetical protein